MKKLKWRKVIQYYCYQSNYQTRLLFNFEIKIALFEINSKSSDFYYLQKEIEE